MANTFFSDNRLHKQILLHISIWSVFVFFSLIQPHQDTNIISPRLVYLLLGNMVLFYVNYSYLVPKFLLKNKTLWYVVFTISLVVFFGIILREIYPILNPERMDFHPFEDKRPQRFFNLKLIGSIIFNILIVVSGTALKVYTEWNKNERKKREIEAQKSITELHFLKHQLSPHFLFNSLNSIYSLTTKKSNDAPEAIITLSELMRYMLYETNNEYVALKKEMEYIQNYLKLQRLRIANNKNVTLNIHGSISDQKIRPLLLISFIENAFKYGTDFKGNTEVKIDIRVKDEELYFKCINLIGNRKTERDSSGIGLQNTKDRLELLYPEKYLFFIEEKESQFIVNLTLKLS